VLGPVLLHVGEEKQRYRVALSEVKAVMLLAAGRFSPTVSGICGEYLRNMRVKAWAESLENER
jgi:hypothetical protein